MDILVWFLALLALTYIIYKSGILEILFEMLQTFIGILSAVYINVKPRSVFAKVSVALISVFFGIFTFYMIAMFHYFAIVIVIPILIVIVAILAIVFETEESE